METKLEPVDQLVELHKQDAKRLKLVLQATSTCVSPGDDNKLFWCHNFNELSGLTQHFIAFEDDGDGLIDCFKHPSMIIWHDMIRDLKKRWDAAKCTPQFTIQESRCPFYTIEQIKHFIAALFHSKLTIKDPSKLFDHYIPCRRLYNMLVPRDSATAESL